MRALVSLGIVCIGGSAAASPCPVEVAHAPDDVRTAIEQWVARETKCGGPLEVRVVPTDGGYYLYARDAQGRTRERLVPDATSAGVLVASWMADDALGDAVHVAVTIDVPNASPNSGPTAEPPLASPLETRVTDTAPPPAIHAAWHHGLAVRALAIGGQNLAGSDLGVRGELDLLWLGQWVVTGAAVYQSGHVTEMFTFDPPKIPPTVSDVIAEITIGRAFDAGEWEFRPALGLGPAWSTARIDQHFVRAPPYPTDTTTFVHTGAYPVAELSCMAIRRLGGGWDAAVAISAQAIYLGQFWSPGNVEFDVDRGFQLTAALGLEYRR